MAQALAQELLEIPILAESTEDGVIGETDANPRLPAHQPRVVQDNGRHEAHAAMSVACRTCTRIVCEHKSFSRIDAFVFVSLIGNIMQGRKEFFWKAEQRLPAILCSVRAVHQRRDRLVAAGRICRGTRTTRGRQNARNHRTRPGDAHGAVPVSTCRKDLLPAYHQARKYTIPKYASTSALNIDDTITMMI